MRHQPPFCFVIHYRYYTSNGTGSNNTFIGYGTIANGDYSNATAIGKGAITTAPGYVVIGSTTVSQIGGWLDWTNMSDGRFKINVTENVKGLEFIKKLRPVTYQMDTKAADDFLRHFLILYFYLD